MPKCVTKSVFFYIVFSLFLIQENFAQDEYNKWVFGIGLNAIDYFPSHAPNTGNENGFLNEFSNAKDHWNISGPQLLATRHLVKNLSVDGLLSFNNITKYGDVPVDGVTYIGMDINFRYSFMDTSKDFTIFMLAGGGYTFASYSGATVNIGTGANYWFSDKVGLNLEALYKYNSDDFNLAPHFYYGLSLVYRLNSGGSLGWRKSCR